MPFTSESAKAAAARRHASGTTSAAGDAGTTGAAAAKRERPATESKVEGKGEGGDSVAGLVIVGFAAVLAAVAIGVGVLRGGSAP